MFFYIKFKTFLTSQGEIFKMCADLGYTRPVVNTALLKLAEKEGNITYRNTKALILSIGGIGYINKWAEFNLYLYGFIADKE